MRKLTLLKISSGFQKPVISKTRAVIWHHLEPPLEPTWSKAGFRSLHALESGAEVATEDGGGGAVRQVRTAEEGKWIYEGANGRRPREETCIIKM